MKNIFIKKISTKYLKIFLVLVIAYYIADFSVNNLFLANSPRLRPNLYDYFLAKINTVKENLLSRLKINFFQTTQMANLAEDKAEDKKREEIMMFLKNNLKPITKGISAASKDGYHYSEFRLDEIEWVRITYTLNNGETITIEYPKGTEPPPKEYYEDLIK